VSQKFVQIAQSVRDAFIVFGWHFAYLCIQPQL
jgi:hypothetical protein